eukprot:6796604-Prymnesium_polylepis.1
MRVGGQANFSHFPAFLFALGLANFLGNFRKCMYEVTEEKLQAARFSGGLHQRMEDRVVVDVMVEATPRDVNISPCPTRHDAAILYRRFPALRASE